MKLSLKAARVNAELTQAQACEILGVGLSTVKNWESGKTAPKATQLAQICAAYKVQLEELRF